MRLSKDLVAASATPMVLAVLAGGHDYGYSILKRITDASGGEIEWSEGLLYPLLHRLERQELVTATWGEGQGGRKRKYYAITTSGRHELEGLSAQWRVVTTTFDALLTHARAVISVFQPAMGVAR